MRKPFVILVLLLFPLPSLCAVPVTGNLKDIATAAVGSGTFVRFELTRCGANVPRITGTSLIVNKVKDFRPNTAGAVSGSLYANNEIDCGGVTDNSCYDMSVYFNNTRQGPPVPVKVYAPGFNINSYQVSSSCGQTPTSPLPVFNYLLSNPTGDQVITQPAGTKFRIIGTLQADAIEMQWNSVLNKPTYFTADWNTTIINRPTIPVLSTPTAGTIGGVYADSCSGSDKVSAIGTNGHVVCTSDQTGSAGTGIMALNTLTSTAQSFAIGTAGTAPAFNSLSSTHTLNIPMAATAGVTAGLVSKAQYDNFAKLDALSSANLSDNANLAKYNAASPTFSNTVSAAGYARADGKLLNPRQITFIVGSDTGSALTDTDDQASIFANRLGQSVTISEVFCESDAGTPAIQLQKDDGSPTNMLSSNLTCSTSGANTTTFVSGENVLANTNKLDFAVVTAGGTAKRVTVVVKYQ